MTLDHFKQAVTRILQNARISPATLETNCYLPRHNGLEIGYKILCAAELPIAVALTALYGPLDQRTCNNELGDVCGFGQFYDTACIRHCISLGGKWVAGDQTCEVGMKYPQFCKSGFIEKWQLTPIGEYESPRCKTLYEIWRNPDETMIWSCEKGRMGEGGYAGLIFQSFEKAIAFAKWYLQNPHRYVKDIDMFINHLGGIDIGDYQDFQSKQEPFQQFPNSSTEN